MNKALITGIALTGMILLLNAPHARSQELDPEALLQEYASAYAEDRMAIHELSFGIEIRDVSPGRWHVTVKPHADKPGAKVTLQPGFPETPTFYYTMELETLKKIESGTWSALTGMARATMDEKTPLDIAFMEGYSLEEEHLTVILSVTSHFWDRHIPEIVNFGTLEHTRTTHGGQATLFYYYEGLRLGYYMLKPGQHINQDPHSRINPFPTYIIINQGELEVILDGETYHMTSGQGFHIPAGVSHQFINSSNALAGMIIVMFGEGA